jgi:DNA repair protein RadA/Sms
MTDKGLSPVMNPSDLFIGRNRSDAAGVGVVPLLQGSRCILAELQTLVNQSFLAMPRRVVSGLDANRLNLVIAVIEKHGGIKFYNRDVFANVAGGLRLAEPGGDLGLQVKLGRWPSLTGELPRGGALVSRDLLSLPVPTSLKDRV